MPKEEEVKRRTWICACDEMQIYKYCHCLLFVTEEDCRSRNTCRRITRGERSTAWSKDPTPDKGRALAKALAKKEAAQ
jgi:ferredoxin-thioredoxin reductase catalytic chain